MSGLLIVRAEVAAPADRAKFERWYHDEHLPDATAAFGARRSWRGWSELDPAVHIAFYEFDDASVARGLADTGAMQGLIAEFDRTWGNRAVRTREIVEVVQLIE